MTIITGMAAVITAVVAGPARLHARPWAGPAWAPAAPAGAVMVVVWEGDRVVVTAPVVALAVVVRPVAPVGVVDNAPAVVAVADMEAAHPVAATVVVRVGVAPKAARVAEPLRL